MHRRASIKDVAERAGVSAATVSNALNHPERVRPERLTKIRRAMDDLQFVRSDPARHLRSGRSSTIGLVLLDAWNPSFMLMAQGVEDAVTDTPWTILIGNSRRDLAREEKYLRAYTEQRAAGLIVAPRDGLGDELARIQSRGTPVVILDRPGANAGQFSVSVNDRSGGADAARHLIDLGHRHIAFIGSPESATPVRERFLGVRHAVTNCGHRVRLKQIDAPLTIAGGRAAGPVLAAMSPRPTAAIAAIDMVAFGLLQALANLNISVPEEISLCGYDDTEFAQQLSIPLTTVRRPHYELGQSAADMLLALLGGHTPPTEHVQFDPELIIRDSTAPPQRAG